ncbi:MAG: HEAT repeat domain-containing protein [Actinomycetota bacterium]
MADKKQGLFGGLLRQPSEGEENRSAGEDATEGRRSGDPVEAYEEDWYRSLKALAAQRQQLAETEEEEEEEEQESELLAEQTTLAPDVAAPTAELEAAEAGLEEEPTAQPSVQELQVSEVAIPQAPTGAAGPSATSAKTPVVEPPPMPAPEATAGSAPAPPLAAPPTGPPPSLTSPDPEQRRDALAFMAAAGELSEEQAERVAALVLDPDPRVRCLAFELLSGRASSLDDETVRRALHDPSDEVRAAAVGLAAARGSQHLPDLIPLIEARRWPQTQRNALGALSELVASGSPLGDEDLAAILTAVGQLDSPPQEWERGPLTRLAAAIGTHRLADALPLPDARRLGAARLLEGDRSPAALRALASRLADPIEEMRTYAAAAARALDETQPEDMAPPAGVATSPEGQRERLVSLARAMRDPDETVRGRARGDLAAVDRATLNAWVGETIHSGDPEAASVAIEIAQLLGLTEVAGDILERAAVLDVDRRGPFVDALRSFGLPPEKIIKLLSSVDAAHRAEAIHITWQVGGAPVLPHVQAYLDDPSAASRMAVLDVMGEGAYVGAADVAKRVLETDLSAVVRAAAVRMVGRRGGQTSPGTIARAFQDPDPNVRMTAVEWLPGGTAAETTNILLEALSDSDERVRRAAVSRLVSRSEGERSLVWHTLRGAGSKERGELTAAVERMNPGTLTELAFESLHSLDEDERVLAVDVLGWGTTQACVEAAIHALQDPSSAVRRMATGSLARLRDPSAAGALGKALADPDPEVRVGVVRALGVIDDESVLGFLVSALNDPEVRVRQVTSEVLTEWSSPAVAKRLAGVLAVPSLRDSASDLLLKMGPSAVELLIDVLRQGHPEVTPTVGSLLQRIVGLEGFVVQTGNVDPDRRMRAMEAIGAIGGPTAVEPLLARLSDPDERVRIRSAQLLGRLGDVRAREPLSTAAASDPVPEAASAAREALASLNGQTTAA